MSFQPSHQPSKIMASVLIICWLVMLIGPGFSPIYAQNSTEDDASNIQPFLLLANTFDIRRLNFDGTDYRFLIGSLSGTVAMDYDYTTGYMYWSHSNGQTKIISRAPLETGSPVEDIITTNLGEPDGLAVDWVNRRLYWTDGALNLVEKANLDGTLRVVVISSGTNKPRGIVLDPHGDRMYFTDVSDTAPSIQRARMSDGFYREIIVRDGLERPNSLTIDFEQSRLYFADAHTDKIESCNLDGSDRRTILDRPSNFHPYGLSIYQDRLYWSDILQHHIMHINKESGRNQVKMEGYFAYPTALHVVHPSRQLLEKRNWCEANNGLGPCHHICRNTYSGYECGCLEGYELIEDSQNTCQDINECSRNNGGCNHHCINTEGTFQCQCIGGFSLLPDGITCADLNECHTDNGNCQYTCYNTESGYYCSCPLGLILTADKHHCVDEDECLQHPCPADGYCANVMGAYTCHCTQGYQYSAVSNTCDDIDECVSGLNRCSQLCINQPSTYRCDCHPGFRITADRVSCVDINECERNTDGCDQRCTNVMGSYICSCHEGFVLSSDDHTCTMILCGQPEAIPGFSVNCHGENYGNTCTLSCEEGELIGNPVITCQSNSRWSIPTAECITSTVTSGDENKPPIRVYLSSNTIPEDATIESVVGTINAIDTDPTQMFTFAMTSDTFQISQQDNTLRTKVPLNYESTSTFSVSITATDNGYPPLSVTSELTVIILDVNEQPSAPSITNSYISEHLQPGGTVGLLQASDPDTDQVRTFDLLSNSNGIFDLDGDTLVVTGDINYESQHMHHISVQVRDSGQPALTNTATLPIHLFDRNDAPTDITLTPDSLPEASAYGETIVGSVIGVLSTEDEDTWDSHTYTISGESAPCFEISESNLLVKDTSCFDYESTPTIAVMVTSTDTGLKSVDRTLHITLTDVEEAPTAIMLSSYLVREHSPPNTVVGMLTVRDPDIGDTHTFFIGGDSDPSLIGVEGNKVIVYSDLSYSDYPAGIMLNIATADSAGKIYSSTYVIIVQDINEPPGEITWHIEQQCLMDPMSVDGLTVDACVEEERSNGAVTARPSVIDPDGDRLSWTILDSSGSFEIESDGTVRVSSKRLNYEVFEKLSHGALQSVVVVATDPGGYTTSSQLNIKVLNINDRPRRVLISNTYIASNTPIGQTVATLTCDDDDSEDVHTFRFVHTMTYFNIVGNQVQVIASLQGQEGNFIPTYIACSDGVEETDAGYIVVNIVDVGETNDITITLDTLYIIENSPDNQVIGVVRAQSQSYPNDAYTLSLPSVYQELFSLRTRPADTNAVDLIAPWPFDYESLSVHNVVIQAVGSSAGTAMEHFTINVLNVNEHPDNITITMISVQENKIGALAGIISAVDPEADDMEFEIVEDLSNAFQLTQLGIANSRQVITTRELDYETEPTLSITIGVKDMAGSGQSTTRTFQISVHNINEAPVLIQPRRFEVQEDSEALTVVGALTVTDPDDVHTPQRIECYMKDDGGGLFVASGTDIQIADGVVLDYDNPANQKTVTVTIECYDQGQLSVITDIDMVIIDVNEAPTDITSLTGLFEIEENNAGGSTLATLVTIDPETPQSAGGHFTYHSTAPLTFPFAIIGDRIIVHQSLNYEIKKFYDMDITTTDRGGLSFTKTIRIQVLDANDPPTSIFIATTAKIYEHSPPNTFVCELTATDEDINQEHTFSIESQTPEGALYVFNGTQLMTSNTVVDYELTDTVSVTITVQDIGASQSGIYVDTFILEVVDINEPPTGLHLSSYTVPENSAMNTRVGQIIVEDPDIFDQTYYCFLGYDGTSNFQLSHTNTEIWLIVGYGVTNFNYENTQSLTLTVWCRDSNPEYFVQELLTIEILDANDPPTGLIFMDAAESTATANASQPIDPGVIGNVITLQTVTIEENAPASVGVVCYIFIQDEDAIRGAEMVHQSAVVELISSDEYNEIMGEGRRRRSPDRIFSRTRRQSTAETSNTDFVIQSGTNYLLVGNELDHETKEEYLVYFKAYDPDIPDKIVVSSLRIVVLDVDEAPQDMELSTTIVTENSRVNSKIGDLNVVDPDGTKTGYVYTMVSLGTPFYVLGNSLHVERHPLDYEVTPAISIQIQVREIDTTLILTKTFHINVTDIPEPPTSLTINGNITVWVPETFSTSGSLGKILANDPDHDDGTMTFTFFNQQPTEFQIEGDELMLVNSLDSWERRLFDLPMQVADSTGLTFRQVIFIRVMEEDRCKEEQYCHQHATCVHNKCQCKVGFDGDGVICTDNNECVPNPCDTSNSYGRCENGIGGLRNFTCTCKPGWTGPDCTNEVDECVDNMCHVPGTLRCNDRHNSYICVCKDGYQGRLCDINIDDCTEDECQNGGLCVDGVNGYTCDCLKPYVGLLCETNSGLCTDVICPNNGTCLPVPNESKTVCRCMEPYAADCQGCSYGYGGVDCQPCPSPYTGKNCEVDSSVCSPNPCQEPGICIPYNKQYACICPATSGNGTVSKCKDTVTDVHPPAPIWRHKAGWVSSIIIAVVALLIFILLLLAVFYCRKHPDKSKFRARYISESQQVILDAQELGMNESDQDIPPPYHAAITQQLPPHRTNPRNNIVSVKVSNDLREATNLPRPVYEAANGDQAVADLVGAISKRIGSRGRQISSAKKNNLGEWEKGVYNEGDKVDTLKKEKAENMYVDLPPRELPVGAVAFKTDQYRPTAHVSPSRYQTNSTPSTNSPTKQRSSNGDVMGIEDSMATDYRELQQSSRNTNNEQKMVFLKDNPVFQGSDDEEDGVPTSFI